ncbi:YlbF family regulator [Bombilactobacillus bombi]|uniref:YlbF family regulator n=1 Tax=Bombilactobacillus bombi TaxID=1303590 RepID=UPI001C6331AE|nr:YlbF family regulator [Bombilactobacillus bombi]
MINVYDTANRLESELRQTPEVMGLQSAFSQMKADAMAYSLFQKMEKLQADFQQKQVSGQEISDEEIKNLQTISGQLTKFDSVQRLMEQERKVNAMMEELNKIISKPLAEIYQG